MSQVLESPLEAGRDAVRRRDWDAAYPLLQEADTSSELAPEDLELLAEAALWGGLFSRVHGRDRTRSYKAYVEAGNLARAAYIATILAHDYGAQLQASVASGWLSRAKRHLDETEEAPEHGYWALQRSLVALGEHDFDEAFRQGKAGRGDRQALLRPEPRDPRHPAPGRGAPREGRGRRGQAAARRGERGRARRRARPVLDARRLLQHDRCVPRGRRLRQRRAVDRPRLPVLRRELHVRLPRACAA